MCMQPADLAMAKTIVLNAKMRRTGVCGAAETLLVDRDAAPTHLAPLVEMLIEAGCEVRGDPETQRADSAGQARDRGRLGQGISRRHHRGESCRRARRGDRAYRALRLAAYRRHRHRGQARPPSSFSPASTAPSCCTTPRPNSPTAASSAWAPRSASPPGASMRAGRWASSSSRPSNMSCTAQARSGLSCSLETVSMLLDTGLGRYDREEIDCRKRG